MMLQLYFQKILIQYILTPKDYVPSIVTNSFHYHPSNDLFDLSQIENGLAKLKNNKSIGPDGLSGVFPYSIRSSFVFHIGFCFTKT